MYTPKYSITHLIVNYLVKYELSIQKISNTPLPRQHFDQLYEKLHAEDINKLGELIGHTIGYSKALETQRGKLLPSSRKEFQIFMNYRSTHDFINTYTSQNFMKPSVELSTHLNKLIMKGLVEDWELEKTRTFSEKPNTMYDTWYKHRDFYPNMKFSQHFKEIYDWINNPPTKIHRLIQLALLLFEYIDKAPFNAGNQITAIATVTAIAKEYKLNPKNLIPFAKTIEFVNTDLEDAFKLSKSKKDLTIFIEALLYSLSMTAINVENQTIDLYENKVSNKGKRLEELNDRQLKVIDYLEIEKKITRSKYTKMMGVSFMTSFRDLQELMEKGYIEQKGVGRGTYYTLKIKEKKEPKKEKEMMVFGSV